MPSSPTQFSKILVVKLGALGDFIQALGPMAAIRKHHKNAEITLLTTKAFRGFGESCGYFDHIITDNKPKLLNLPGWVALRKALNNVGYDRVYDLQNNDRTSFYFKLLAPKPEWVGVAKGASHRNTSHDRTAGHAFDGHVQTLGLAGIQNVKVDPLNWMKADITTLGLQERYILLVPGCAPTRPEKRWPHYTALANMIAKQGLQPVILGTDAEREVTQEIAKNCPDALDLTGKTSLAHIATLGRNAAGAVGNDTGPMHLIGATGCPSLILFSAHSNPVKHAPKGDHVSVLQKPDLNDLTPEIVAEQMKSSIAVLKSTK